MYNVSDEQVQSAKNQIQANAQTLTSSTAVLKDKMSTIQSIMLILKYAYNTDAGLQKQKKMQTFLDYDLEQDIDRVGKEIEAVSSAAAAITTGFGYPKG